MHFRAHFTSFYLIRWFTGFNQIEKLIWILAITGIYTAWKLIPVGCDAVLDEKFQIQNTWLVLYWASASLFGPIYTNYHALISVDDQRRNETRRPVKLSIIVSYSSTVE